MIKITAGQAQRLTTPAPFGLVSTKKEDGSTNLNFEINGTVAMMRVP